MAMAGKPECTVLFELFSTARGRVAIGRIDHGEHAGRIVLLRELEASLVTVVSAEAEVTRRFTHPQILKLLGVFSDGERSYVASEYLPAVSLFELLARIRARQTALELGAAVHIAMETLRLVDRAGSLLREAGRPRVRLFYADCVWIADYGETLLAEAGVSAYLASGRNGAVVDQGTQANQRDAMTLTVELVQLATARLVTGDLARVIHDQLPAPLADALDEVLMNLTDGGADAADPIATLSRVLRGLPPKSRGSETMVAGEVARIARDLFEERRSKLAELQVSSGPDASDVTRIYAVGAAQGGDTEEVTAMVMRPFRGVPVPREPVEPPPSSAAPIPLSATSIVRKGSAAVEAQYARRGGRKRAKPFGRALLIVCAGAALIALTLRHPEWCRAVTERLLTLFR